MRYSLLALLTLLFVLPAQGQALIPTVTSSTGLSPTRNIQGGATMMGSQSTTSIFGGASALYIGRHLQSAYVGPTIRILGGGARLDLLTGMGVSHVSPGAPPNTSEPVPSNVYPLSSMFGITVQGSDLAILVGLAHVSGYTPTWKGPRPNIAQYDHAQMTQVVVGLGWSL